MENIKLAQFILLLLISLLFLIKTIPVIIDDYRNSKISSIKPYAYFKLNTEKIKLSDKGVMFETNFSKCCNKLGLLFTLQELDNHLKEEGTDLIELIKDVRKQQKDETIQISDSADRD